MLSKDRCKTTSGFSVIQLLSQLWEEKNYCERRNELSSWRPVALPNRHKHLCLFKLGYDVHVLLSSVMYIRFQWFATNFAESSCFMWGQAHVRPKNGNILKKNFSLQWSLSYFDVVFYEMLFFCEISNFNSRDPSQQIFTIFPVFFIYRTLKLHTKNQISKSKIVATSYC